MEKKRPISPLELWAGQSKKPYVVAGPCSAETQEQVLATARGLKSVPQVRLLRAGLWKARTRPSSFEGVGEGGLPWMAKAREETGYPVAVEVATGGHVDMCLKHGVDVLWIGARTSVNPLRRSGHCLGPPGNGHPRPCEKSPGPGYFSLGRGH